MLKLYSVGPESALHVHIETVLFSLFLLFSLSTNTILELVVLYLLVCSVPICSVLQCYMAAQQNEVSERD